MIKQIVKNKIYIEKHDDIKYRVTYLFKGYYLFGFIPTYTSWQRIAINKIGLWDKKFDRQRAEVQ